MRPGLEVEVAGGRLDEVAAELMALLLFEDQRPLRGPTGWVDWRLQGLISRRLLEGWARGSRDEALLIPTQVRFATPRAMGLGAGSRVGFGGEALAAWSRTAVERALALRTGRLVVPLPSPSHAGVDAARAAGAILEGAVGALASAGASLDLVLWAAEESLAAAWRGAREAVDGQALAVPARLRPPPTSDRPQGAGLRGGGSSRGLHQTGLARGSPAASRRPGLPPRGP